TIRRSSACWVPTRTYSVRSSSTRGSSASTPMIVSTSGSRSIACASLPPQWVERPVIRTRRERIGGSAEPDALARLDQLVEVGLNAGADVVRDGLDERLVLPGLGAP